MARAPGAARKAADPKQEATARAIGRLLWEREFRKNNPGADAAAKKEAWTAQRGEFVRAGRQLYTRLEKAGFKITPPAEEAA
jgi:hypothetical protein